MLWALPLVLVLGCLMENGGERAVPDPSPKAVLLQADSSVHLAGDTLRLRLIPAPAEGDSVVVRWLLESPDSVRLTLQHSACPEAANAATDTARLCVLAPEAFFGTGRLEAEWAAGQVLGPRFGIHPLLLRTIPAPPWSAGDTVVLQWEAWENIESVQLELVQPAADPAATRAELITEASISTGNPQWANLEWEVPQGWDCDSCLLSIYDYIDNSLEFVLEPLIIKP